MNDDEKKSFMLVNKAMLFATLTTTFMAYLVSLFVGLHLWMFPVVTFVSLFLTSLFIIESMRNGTK